MDPQRRDSEEVGRDMSFVFLFLLTAALSARDNQAGEAADCIKFNLVY